jgi:hypothetical protein
VVASVANGSGCDGGVGGALTRGFCWCPVVICSCTGGDVFSKLLLASVETEIVLAWILMWLTREVME